MDPFAVPPTPVEGEFDSLPVLRLVGPDEKAPAGTPRRVLLEFFVPLRPRTKGSLRPVAVTNRAGQLQRVFLKEQIEAGPAWRERCASEAQDALGRLTPEGVAPAGFPYVGPVSVTTVFHFRRYPSDDEPYPTKRYYGDADKLVRNAWDALTDAGVIKDDSLVVDFGDSCKEFAAEDEPVGAWIQVVAK